MHELTVALQIRSSVEQALASDADDLEVEVVRIQVGALSNVVPAALHFAWPHARADSALLGQSRLEIDWIDARISCRACHISHSVSTVVSLRCPTCDSPDVDVVGGDELDIAGVDVRPRQPVEPRPVEPRRLPEVNDSDS